MTKVHESEELLGPLDRDDRDISSWSPEELLGALDQARDRLRDSRIQDAEERLSRIYGGDLNAQLEFVTKRTVDTVLDKLKAVSPAAAAAKPLMKSKLLRKTVKYGSKLFGPEGAAVGKVVDKAGSVYDRLPKGSKK